MSTFDQLPDYLKAYCVEQDMSKYTARDHAAWRYIMRRAVAFFRDHAVHVYEDGLRKTGIPLESIPSVAYMDKALNEFGWGAVPVCGFIAPWAFLEFQSRQILPIATDMRTVDHIGYTPAPDIVHEAAGHAPILPDEGYAAYLSDYGQVCTKAIYCDEDIRLYHAIRVLSDIKEKPESTAEQIAKAELELSRTVKAMTKTSEQGQIARMSWWTNEYGLVGDLKDPKIYGAGLLSSVEESRNLYSDAVKKIPLSLACIEVGYDITKPQPQLFVARDMQHIVDVLNELKQILAFVQGGAKSLHKALEAKAVSTTVFDNAVAVSGKIVAFEEPQGQIAFIRWAGPCQITMAEREVMGQGKARHPEGFSCPIGQLKGLDKSTAHLKSADLVSLGVVAGQESCLEYRSGITVKGRVTDQVVDPASGCIKVLTFENCRVTWQGRALYEPEWGPFDLVLGAEVSTVYGGPADREAFGDPELGEVSTTPGRESPFSEHELQTFGFYQVIRDHRQGAALHETELQGLAEKALNLYPQEWLAQLELYELAHQQGLGQKPWAQRLQLQLGQRHTPPVQELVDQGMALLA